MEGGAFQSKSLARLSRNDALFVFLHQTREDSVASYKLITEEYLEELKREEGENFVRSDWPLYFEELNGPRRMETIWDGLASRGMSESNLEKLFGLNLQRLYKEVIG